MSRYGATVLRLILGLIYLMHGYHALAVLGPSGSMAFVERLGLPLPFLGGWYLIAAHLVGGAMLVIGLWTRWAALAQVPIMVGAVLLVHLKQGFFMRSQGLSGPAAGYEFALLVLVATIAQILLGGGALALTRD
ncbi:MAG: DoxX family protein [Candidatus Rokubacteria bacterium]|nr:DoxX family protein [Candidatus Rokubacteria bacterium]